MKRKPISCRMPAVIVEYDLPDGKRKQKRFEDAFEARRFWIAKDKNGKNPKVRRTD